MNKFSFSRQYQECKQKSKIKSRSQIIAIILLQLILFVRNGYGQPVKSQRVLHQKTNVYLTGEKRDTLVFIIKFMEGTNIKLDKNQILFVPHKPSSDDEIFQKRYKLNSNIIVNELNKFNSKIRSINIVSYNRLFKRNEILLEKEKLTLEKKINSELSNLNLYFKITCYEKDKNKLQLVLNEMLNLNIVETIYMQYKSMNAGIVEPFSPNNSSTFVIPDLSSHQEYLNPSPIGIDAKYGWSFTGGKGDGIRIIDIETSWNNDHEDLKSPFFNNDYFQTFVPYSSIFHGTAVAGEIIGQHNGIGVMGISPNSQYGFSTVVNIGISHDDFVSEAIEEASENLRAGDIILIEQHTPGPCFLDLANANDCGSNGSQVGFLPMEFYPDCFDIIQYVSSSGIIVVEAAGNGGVNLDRAEFGRKFDRNFRDSKALFVAADEGGNGIPANFTNLGSRIDFFSWGKNVVSCGLPLSTLEDEETDQRRGDLHDSTMNTSYTQSFGGTSAASPIIAGSIAIVQGIRKRTGLPLWNAEDIRRHFLGIAQRGGENKNIGIQPDLKLLLDTMLNKPPKPNFRKQSGDYPIPFEVIIDDLFYTYVPLPQERNLRAFFNRNISIPTENSEEYSVPFTINRPGIVNLCARSFYTPYGLNIRVGSDTSLVSYNLYRRLRGPSNVRTENFTDSVRLSWNTLNNVLRYQIFSVHGHGNSRRYLLIDQVEGNKNKYIDNCCAGSGQIKKYCVRAIFNDTHESNYSSSAVGKFLISGIRQTALYSELNNCVNITWELPPWGGNSNQLQFKVYRSNSNIFSEANEIGNYSMKFRTVVVNHHPVSVPNGYATEMEDCNLISGITYYYWVICLDISTGRISKIIEPLVIVR